MRRVLAVSALAASIVGLTAVPAIAHEDEGDAGGGEWMPVDPAFYEVSGTFEACGTTITMTTGDVREVEERFTELNTGELLREFRGASTLDFTRADGAMIDELDVGGAGWELHHQVGDQVRVTNVLYGASVLFPGFGEIDVKAAEAAGIPAFAYWADPEDRAQVEIAADIETGEPISVTWIHVDAEFVDLCTWFEEDHHADSADYHHDTYSHHDTEYSHHRTEYSHGEG